MKKVNTIKIGKTIQQIRKSFGYTQEKLAEQIEISTRYMSQIEQDRVTPSYEVLIRFCNVLKIDIGEIFSPYLEKTQRKILPYELVGFETLKEEDKKTIEYLIAFFNSNNEECK